MEYTPMWKYFLIVVAAILLGLLLSVAFLEILPQIPQLRKPELYKRVGIRTPQIIGFQPYWLLAKKPTDYSSYTTDTTYFGLEIDGEGKIVKKANEKEEEPGWTALNGEKLKDRLAQDAGKGITTSLLLHTATEAQIRALLVDPTSHAQNLVAEVKPLMQEHDFSDLNIDIESFNLASPAEQLAFTEFTRRVKKGLAENDLGTLTVDVTPATLVNKHLIDPIAIGQIADRVVLMTYDYHYSGSEVSGPVAPIGGTGISREIDVETSVKEALKFIPKEKIYLGIPLYGYEWETLSDQPGSPTIPGTNKTATNLRAEELKAKCTDCQKGIDQTSQEPFLILPPNETSATQQIYYEDKTSLEEKIELAKHYHLGGVALWAMGYESPEMLKPLEEYKKWYYWQAVPGGTTSYWARFFPQ